MSGLVLQTTAISVVNKGGGHKGRTVRQEVPGFVVKKFVRVRQVTRDRVPGTDYVVWNCPWPDCGTRNKHSVYEAKGSTGDGRLGFKCKRCLRETEVARPIGSLGAGIVAPPSSSPTVGLLGPDGKPIARG